MSEYKITIKLESNCMLGAGEGWGSVIDADIVFDNVGLPYLPARRLKGCLRESAKEVLEMMECAGIKKFESQIIDKVFGCSGDATGAGIVFNNLYLPNYKDVYDWCKWALQECNSAVSPEIIVNSFTSIKQQTSINNEGIADDKSLRTFRVLKRGIEFEGAVNIKEEDKEAVDLLALACLNLRYIGTMRNRGYGKIVCRFKKGNEDLSQSCIEQIEREAI
ncbi:MAG: hypothetical protein GXW90_09255 [Tepidanaerobacter acetatoxydans]|uniref:CRISPR type III-associated protein domain-containing protein n=1 Tax=Tepidanaerobacter acetatoxydans (strain DSM 21804 / JCM 16047 / Re1) TaxID=1209989 RepID=L0RYW8_TEPAE|nr:RAMP superfamily CRISPR-associated protein [Tepidanaerobacter acetatoxydans]NLU11099.1 hypothetical protein [Tepidanaerobacter acetatoxydans]CCP24818.1 conserved protein of unknown function [Tepidanaerobacter acetatoxydans Re1]